MSEATVAVDQLRLFIERIERLEEERKGISDDVRDVYAEAKANGYDTKTMRKVVALRKMETHTRQEQDALLETYRAALGMEVSEYVRVRAPQAREPTPIERVIETVAETVNSGALDTPNATVRMETVSTPSQLYNRAAEAVARSDSIFATGLAAEMKITGEGAMKLLDRMERDGLVGPPDALGRRQVLQQATMQ